MNIEAMRLWAKHDQGHASTFLTLEDARLVVEAYDLLKSIDEHEDDEPLDVGNSIHYVVGKMEGV